MKSMERKQKQSETQEEWRSSRNTYFVSAYSNRWQVNLSKIFNDKAAECAQKWIRIRYSKTIHPTFATLLAGDRQAKIMEGISSKDFISLPCNCSEPIIRRSGNNCPWKGNCREKVIVYKITCVICQKFYIGSTQNALKQRTSMHIQNIRDLFLRNKTSSTLAKHFSKHLHQLRAHNDINIEINFGGSNFKLMLQMTKSTT